MAEIDQIKQPIAKAMGEFEGKFKASISSKVALLKRITTYITDRRGKQLRPVFVFLSAKLFGEVNESSHRAASLIELLHTASLVHDDVVDDANLRRGFFSVNALWKNKIAVLVGDYFLSRLLLIAVKNKEFGLLEITSTAVEEMSEGELLQIEKARKLDITEEVYFEIIRKKTAALIAACCAAGASTTSSNPEEVDNMHAFGEKVGLAFQIKDDLFDYQKTSGLIGKPVGIDSRIGRKPIFAGGNSDGDFEMLEYTTNGDGPSFGLIVHHTDTDREFAYDRDGHIGTLNRGLDEGPALGWVIIDMARDWEQVWPK